jgi:hypothetical protein
MAETNAGGQEGAAQSPLPNAGEFHLVQGGVTAAGMDKVLMQESSQSANTSARKRLDRGRKKASMGNEESCVELIDDGPFVARKAALSTDDRPLEFRTRTLPVEPKQASKRAEVRMILARLVVLNFVNKLLERESLAA